MKGLIAGLACFIFFSTVLTAQSIYSAQGLGSFIDQGNPKNFAMGGLGIGTSTNWSVNTKNPAFLVTNPLSSFQLGINLDSRSFSGNGVSGSDADGGLSFLAYAFPIKPGVWNSSFGILPFSNVNYDVFTEGQIADAPNNASFLLDQQGEGGLTNLYWSNGFAINKNLFLGIRTSFKFGSIQRSTRVSIFEERVFTNENDAEEKVDILVNGTITLNEIESYKGIDIQLGGAYRFFLSDSKFINLGLTYTPKSSLDLQVEKRDSIVSNSNANFSLPSTLGVGFSYEKLNLVTIGLDVESETWKKAQPNGNYQNSLKVVLGGSWIPDYDNVNSYFRRVTYSVGFNYRELPYIVKNQALTEFGINFGASLPVRGFSSLDVAFNAGQLGETNNGLIKETYFKVVIGATINDRWFIKRKYD